MTEYSIGTHIEFLNLIKDIDARISIISIS